MLNSKIIELSAQPAGFGKVPDQLEQHMFVSDLPVQHTHLYYENKSLGLTIGVWDTTEMREQAAPAACDEFMWILEGEVAIKNTQTGSIEKVHAGESFIIPKGFDCQWQQTGYLRKIFVIYETPDENPNEDSLPAPVFDGIIKLLAKLLSGTLDNDQPHKRHYQSKDQRFSVESWQIKAFESSLITLAEHQFICLLSGELILYDEKNTEKTYQKGAAFFLPKNSHYRWKSTVKSQVLVVKLDAALDS